MLSEIARNMTSQTKEIYVVLILQSTHTIWENDKRFQWQPIKNIKGNWVSCITFMKYITNVILVMPTNNRFLSLFFNLLIKIFLGRKQKLILDKSFLIVILNGAKYNLTIANSMWYYVNVPFANEIRLFSYFLIFMFLIFFIYPNKHSISFIIL